MCVCEYASLSELDTMIYIYIYTYIIFFIWLRRRLEHLACETKTIFEFWRSAHQKMPRLPKSIVIAQADKSIFRSYEFRNDASGEGEPERCQSAQLIISFWLLFFRRGSVCRQPLNCLLSWYTTEKPRRQKWSGRNTWSSYQNPCYEPFKPLLICCGPNIWT